MNLMFLVFIEEAMAQRGSPAKTKSTTAKPELNIMA